MSVLWIFIAVLGLSLVGFFAGRTRAIASGGGDIRVLHSLPKHYGAFVSTAALLPAVIVLALWSVLSPAMINSSVASLLPTSETSADLALNDVKRIANGLDQAVAQGRISKDASYNFEGTPEEIAKQLGAVGIALGSAPDTATMNAAESYRAKAEKSRFWRGVAVLAASVLALLLALRVTDKEFRARNTVERVVKGLLILSASIAVFTTIGIVASMLFESRNFFAQYPAFQFFFGTNWAPNFRGGSDLGILPLLWGTLYISFIALIFAVPIGLFAAIYMSEYAGPKLRAVAKPMIEVLAGIPTIVYGLFALVTVGPLLRDYFAQPLGFGESASSVMTAGIVMGIMLIPFVSSLSDDILNAVPQTMRDASLGLGATQSETIKQVVLPAALPGIVGAVLLAASRAIGETMIVVMGAGAAAKLSLNPFEAMTTVTVKIVSQLTGDTDFASPETLVAFALGLTLFAFTLCLNVLALYIVRKYREQYE
ncbi:phosphate ABC transporter permease subunit PstC [Halocynthiibacter sp. C4]|uniref:phosphate ABC transporter permease subunit PstC n=1 Tax=Halocynthiibacter sp. C4 TaxID=2992758 RepID=UPI00237A5661|nr:phosphate ABC transporter permease subunit PstC [Halocynthiibacter sp. C4]MDE0589600.1 phosphate ABC transporter permease subunit PstC [Halocynthiibacter sp. C4]